MNLSRIMTGFNSQNLFLWFLLICFGVAKVASAESEESTPVPTDSKHEALGDNDSNANASSEAKSRESGAAPKPQSKKPKKEIYTLIESSLITPQWLEYDLYTVHNHSGLRYPHPQQRYGITYSNQLLVMLSKQGKVLIPNCSRALQLKKKHKRLLAEPDYLPIRARGLNRKHEVAYKIGERAKTFRATDEILIPLLYFPTGWMLFILLVFMGWVFLIPLLGAFLINTGATVASIFNYVLWGPLKRMLRLILIKQEVRRQKWLRHIAPDYYLEPRSTWKMPYFLRNDYLEDIPPEVSYKPPINRIDYTTAVINSDDYEECDLEMDELEYIDQMLQFKTQDPGTVARLLRHKLGLEKFYKYFDEEIFTQEEEKDEEEEKAEKDKPADDIEYDSDGEERPDYMKVFDLDEPWMHPEFDETFQGTPRELEEIRTRRELLKEIRDEIYYIHNILQQSKIFESNQSQLPVEEKIKIQNKARRLLEKYVRFSNVKKARIEEVEPSTSAQHKHNVAMNKYLPQISDLSHFNHRLNLRHEKHRDPAKRIVQLDTFGGP